MMNRRSVRGALAVVTLALLACSPACSSEDGGTGTGGSGAVQIFVVAEETVTNGLEPGSDPEQIQDGWKITYDRYLVAVGNFRARRSDNGDSLGDPAVFIVDLKKSPTSGFIAKEFSGVAAVRWDKFGYDVPNAKAGDKPLAPTTQADADLMIQNGYSVYYEGHGLKAGKKITFKWGFAAGTAFDDCASPDGVAGFAVPAGGSVQIKPTLHGDHQYFDNVTQGVELTARRADWLSACDKDANGELTIVELKGCDVVIALPQPPYDLTSVKDQDGDGKISVFDYVATQMRTFGDYQGDGECPTRTAR